MSQPLLTESSDKAKQQIGRREPHAASARSFQAGPNPILQLQRALGNYRVAQLIKAKRLMVDGRIICGKIPGLQPKITVGAADDQYEQEADRIARQVVSMPDAAVANSMQRVIPPEEDKDKALQTKPLASITPFVQRQMENNEEPEKKEPAVQAKWATGTSSFLQRQSILTDEYEQESNRSAGQVMRIPEPRQQSSLDGIRVDSRNENRALFPILLTSPVHVQCDEIEMEGTDVHPKGLLAAKQVKRVSGQWVNLWRSKKDSTIRMLLDNMLKILNAELSRLEVAPVIFDPTPSKTEGGFRQQEWRMQINLDIDLGRKVSLDDKASTLSADEVAVIGNTLYHEARHAEQSFLVARKRATTIRDPDVLAKTLDIPVSIANAAIAAGRPGSKDPGAERIEEWSAFEQSGRYFAYWKWNETMKTVTKDILEPIVTRSLLTLDEFSSMAELIDRKIKVLRVHWSFPYDEISKIEKLPAPNTLDTEVLAQLRRITSAFNKLILAINAFHLSVSLLKNYNVLCLAAGCDPDEKESRILDATVKWHEIQIAQPELFIAQDNAYLAYPTEIDARRAGEAAKESILAATRTKRVR